MHAHTHLSSICSGDYDPLTKFCLGPFNDSVDQLSFNVSIVNDNIPEDDEKCSVPGWGFILLTKLGLAIV